MRQFRTLVMLLALGVMAASADADIIQPRGQAFTAIIGDFGQTFTSTLNEPNVQTVSFWWAAFSLVNDPQDDPRLTARLYRGVGASVDGYLVGGRCHDYHHNSVGSRSFARRSGAPPRNDAGDSGGRNAPARLPIGGGGRRLFRGLLRGVCRYDRRQPRSVVRANGAALTIHPQ